MNKIILFSVYTVFCLFACRVPPTNLANNNKSHEDAVIFNFDKEKNNSSVYSVLKSDIDYAVASWWGFNKDNATDCLQKAIDSGVKMLYVPDMGSPWYIEPVFLESNQEIIFESGCIIKAKEGAFQKYRLYIPW